MKPAEVVQEAIQVLEENGCHVKKLKRKTGTVLAKQGLASLHGSKYVGVDGFAAIQCFVYQPVKADCSSIAQTVLALVELR